VTWIQQVLQATSCSESPIKFFYWSALAAISAVVKRSIYLDRHIYELYPNIYVLLIAPSGLRKGYPVNLARKLVESVDCTRMVVGRSSIQGIVKALGKVHTLKSGEILKEAHGFINASEFASSLVEDPVALKILTDLYDCHFYDDWENTLASVPISKLVNICITLLGASNEVYLKDAIPDSAARGGFIARTFIVYDDKKSRIEDLVNRPEFVPNVIELSKHLKEIAKLRGKFQWSDRAKKVYQPWYQDFSLKGKNDATGTMERIHDSILKVASLISLSRKLDMILEGEDMEEALEVCLDTVVGMRKVVMGVGGKSEFSDKTALVLRALLDKPEHKMTRQQMLIKYWGDIDSIDLDRVIETLVQAEAITAQRVGKNIVYELTNKAINLYSSFKEEE